MDISLLDSENYECNKLSTEEETIKQCANIEINEIINEEIGRGTFGMVFPIIANINGTKVTLIVKKITSKFGNKSEKNNLIKDMYYEVEYSYKMGSLGIGPIVYDAFYYNTRKQLHQYIIMEKFDTSVRKWIRSKDPSLNEHNCKFVTQSMLNLLHRQIFEIGLYCSDVKPDNYIINFNPIKVRMIDFGIDWCTSRPDLYIIIPELRKYSKQQHKEIFYLFCVLQLMMEMAKYLSHQDPIVFKWLLKPFYTDQLFKKHILSELNESPKKSSAHVKRSKRRSLKRRHEISDIKMILYSILEYGKDQGITLAHYLKENNRESNKEIVDRTFNKLKKISTMLN